MSDGVAALAAEAVLVGVALALLGILLHPRSSLWKMPETTGDGDGASANEGGQ